MNRPAFDTTVRCHVLRQGLMVCMHETTDNAGTQERCHEYGARRADLATVEFVKTEVTLLDFVRFLDFPPQSI
jgi:hypothetical protein